MTNREFFLQCWEQEHPTFLRVLRAVPAGGLDYRPDPRSRSAAELVWLQVLEKRCYPELAETCKVNWATPPPAMGLGEMIEAYDRAHREAVPRVQRMDDKTWETQPTQFLIEGRVAIETTMGHMFWLGLFDAIHHRGQLSVYIRAMGGKVPSIYGPSADDPGPTP